MTTVELGTVATIDRKGVDPSTVDPDTLYLGLEHIERGGRIVGHDTVGGAELASTKFQFTAEHVLFGKLRPNLGKISRPGFSGVCSTDILPIRPGKDLDRDYLAHYLAQPSMVDFAASRTSGANLPRLSPTVLATFPLPLPPLAEQRRIAAILDHADALRAKRLQVLAHLDSLTQSIFNDMFGDPDRAPEEVAFGSVTGLSGGRNLVADDSATDCPFRVLKISAVTTGQFKPNESKPLPPDYLPPISHIVRVGDLLMSRANTTQLVGAVAYVTSTPPNLALPDKIWRFDWKVESEPIFYHALLSTPAIRRRISRLSSGTGGSMKNVSKAKLETMPLPRVSLDRQRAFVDRAQRVAEQRSLHQHAATHAHEVFSSLQTRAFRGEL